jgi:hypothetical protein
VRIINGEPRRRWSSEEKLAAVAADVAAGRAADGCSARDRRNLRFRFRPAGARKRQDRGITHRSGYLATDAKAVVDTSIVDWS